MFLPCLQNLFGSWSSPHPRRSSLLAKAVGPCSPRNRNPKAGSNRAFVASIAYEHEPYVVARIVLVVVTPSGHGIQRMDLRLQVVLAIHAEHACQDRVALEVKRRMINGLL